MADRSEVGAKHVRVEEERLDLLPTGRVDHDHAKRDEEHHGAERGDADVAGRAAQDQRTATRAFVAVVHPVTAGSAR